MKWSNVTYSEREIMKMQQDAVKRVKDMQQRTRDTVSGKNRPPEAENGPLPNPNPPVAAHSSPPPVSPEPPAAQVPRPEVHLPSAQPQPSKTTVPPKSGGLLSGLGSLGALGGLGENISATINDAIASVSSPVNKILDALGLDGERLLILMIMLVVFNERGDKTLLLALGYLLL